MSRNLGAALGAAAASGLIRPAVLAAITFRTGGGNGSAPVIPPVTPPVTPPTGYEIVQCAANAVPATASPLVIPFPSPVTAGNTLIVFGFQSDVSYDTVTDTLGNAYTQAYHDYASGFEVFLANSTAAGDNVVSVSSSVDYLEGAIILEVSGLATNPFDGCTANGESAGSVDTGSLSTTAANDLILVSGYGGAPLAETSGRTLVASFAAGDYGIVRGVWASPAAASGSYSATLTSGGEVTAAIFALKTDSGGASSPAGGMTSSGATISDAAVSTAVTYVWSGTVPLVYAGNTYQGVGSLGSIGTISEGTEVEAKGTSIGLSGIDIALLGDCLAEIQVGAPATLWLALLDQNGAIIGVPYPLYAGTVDKASISIGAETLSISLAIENRLTNLQRASNRRYTAADQALAYPTDRAFNWVEILNDLALRWGN